jgi:DNA-binding NarL/FixJ family response regulator
MRVLPASAVALLLAIPRERRLRPPLARTDTVHGSRLVFVEDNGGLRSAVSKYMTENGFQCETYAEAQEALRAMVRGPRPDLVITDVMMQGMDGIALLRRIRADQRLCAIPVVLLTARGMTSDRIAGYSAGASAYLCKPFDPEELLALVNTLLANALLARAAVLQEELFNLAKDVSTTKQLLQLLLLQSQRGQEERAGRGAGAPSALPSPRQLADLSSDVFALAVRPSNNAANGIAAAADAAAAASSALIAQNSNRNLPALTRNVPRLTKREREVLELVGQGMLNKEIATSLSVSKGHIEKYIRRLNDKTGTSNRTELVRRALQLGLLTLDPPPPHEDVPIVPMREVPPEQGWGQARNLER